MLFASLQYLLFLPLVVVLYWTLPKKYRLPMLLAASWYFYMSWCPIMILLIVGMTVVNFILGKKIYMASAKERKHTIFSIGVIFNVLCLGVFKYSNFVISNVSEVIGLVSGHNPHWSVDILLPLAISFFTFEFIHYLFEVYRGSKPVDSFVLFALFAAFFPTQIAGPIKRYADFVKQMTADRIFDESMFDKGVCLIIVGLAKKVLIADHLAVLVGMVQTDPGAYGSVELWIMAYAFAFQIYFDFSGYTDIARGSAMLLGYEIPINFNIPFAAKNMTDFWQRWHISLSTWWRDYLFMPLWKMSAKSRWQTHRATFITMVVSGLWHGANWNFIVWGAVHGLALIIHREFLDWRTSRKILTKFFAGRIWRYFSIFLTFHSVCVCFVLFRTTNIFTAFSIIKRMFIWNHVYSPGTAGQFVLVKPELPIIVPIALTILSVLLIQNLPVSALIERKYFTRLPVPLKAAFYAATIVAMVIFLPNGSPPFIYFQF